MTVEDILTEAQSILSSPIALFKSNPFIFLEMSFDSTSESELELSLSSGVSFSSLHLLQFDDMMKL